MFSNSFKARIDDGDCGGGCESVWWGGGGKVKGL